MNSAERTHADLMLARIQLLERACERMHAALAVPDPWMHTANPDYYHTERAYADWWSSPEVSAWRATIEGLT